MAGRLDLTQRQVRALCEGAKKAGYAPMVRIGKVLVVLVPEERAIHETQKQDVDEPEDIRL